MLRPPPPVPPRPRLSGYWQQGLHNQGAKGQPQWMHAYIDEQRRELLSEDTIRRIMEARVNDRWPVQVEPMAVVWIPRPPRLLRRHQKYQDAVLIAAWAALPLPRRIDGLALAFGEKVDHMRAHLFRRGLSSRAMLNAALAQTILKAAS